MKTLIQLQKAIYPDLLSAMQKRFHILYTISLLQPIGRRSIVEQTNFPERFIRNELTLLENQGLVMSTTRGMTITEVGEQLVSELTDFMRELNGLAELEIELQKKMAIQKVIIVPGNSDSEDFVKQELGRATVNYLRHRLINDATIAVTGGTTMAAVAGVMQPFEGVRCTFVPARGGVGEKVENQANTIVAQMAKAENGKYQLLHVPDPLSENLYQTLLKEPHIQDTIPIIKNAQFVLHGIGDAMMMASRRKTTDDVREKLIEEKAVSEAFGYYLNEAGEIVHKVRTIGIHLEDLNQMNVVTIAGGTSKARAITSFVKLKKPDVLITDEAAAHEIIKQNLI